SLPISTGNTFHQHSLRTVYFTGQAIPAFHSLPDLPPINHFAQVTAIRKCFEVSNRVRFKIVDVRIGLDEYPSFPQGAQSRRILWGDAFSFGIFQRNAWSGLADPPPVVLILRKRGT